MWQEAVDGVLPGVACLGWVAMEAPAGLFPRLDRGECGNRGNYSVALGAAERLQFSVEVESDLVGHGCAGVIDERRGSRVGSAEHLERTEGFAQSIRQATEIDLSVPMTLKGHDCSGRPRLSSSKVFVVYCRSDESTLFSLTGGTISMFKRTRSFLTLVIAAFALIATACGSDSDSPAESAATTTAAAAATTTAAAAATTTEASEAVAASADGTGYSVAFLLDLFIDDGGWNSTFGRAIEDVKEAFPGLEVQTLEEISPGTMTTDIAEDLAMDGVDMVIATTYVQDDILAIADMYPDTKFLTWAGWQTADNVGHYDAATEDGRYLDGLIAGSITKTGKVGYVAGFSFEEPNRALNAFTIGLKEMNPEATVDVVFINSWWDPPVEAQAAEALANAGADILAHELNSPALASVAEERGLNVIGYTSDRSAEAPNAWLSSFTIEWGPYFIDQISSMLAGNWEAELTFGGLADDMIGHSPYGPDVTDEIIALVDEARAGIIDGSLDFFAGPLKDNEGNVVVAEGDTIPFEERTTCCLWLLEGVASGD